MFNSQGKIITFYSYKGGVGRSMILANIAWILASNGKRVLVIDWDLEAPGIHRYFHPFLLDKNLTSTEGLIDFFRDFVDAAFTPVNKNEGDDENWYEPFTDILRYAVSLDWHFPKNGTIDFVPAGKQGGLYATQVNSFNWDRFYELGGGRFIEIVKEKMRREYDYILIDSRTGVSDTSGICTVQMPDMLVVVFTGNNQSISGAVSVASSVIKQWQTDPNYSPPKWPIFPVLSRTDRSEKDKLDITRDYVKFKFAPFLQHLSETERKEYWGNVEIPYIQWYSYEEVLVTFRDNPYQRDSLLAAIEQLVTYLTDKEIHELVAPSDLEREKILSKFIRQFSRNAPVKSYEDSPSPSIANNPEIFVSYARVDNEPLPGLDKGWVTTLITGLQNLLGKKLDSYRAYSLWMDYDSRDNQSVTPSIIEKLENSAILLLILSPNYIESKWCREELSTFLSKVANASGRIFIVERNNVERPISIRDLLGYKFWVRDDYGKLHTLDIPKPKTEEIEYYQILDDLANDLSDKIKSLREQAIPTRSAFSHNIFLAAVSEDLDKQRNEVKRYLEQQGIRVLPDKEYSFANIQQYLEQDLSQCSLFVQLLSDKMGHGLAQFQYEHARRTKLPILQWRDRALDVNTVYDAAHRTFLSQPTVFASNLVKFQDHIINCLKSIEKAEKTVASTKTKDLVFINAIPENMSLASQIAEILLTTQGIDCVLPLNISNHTSPTDIQNNLNENLLSCDAVIVLYTDDTPISWLMQEVQYCRRIQAKREQDFKIIAVCNNSFTNKPSLSVPMPNLRVLKCPKLQVESGLSEFIRILRR